MALRVLICRHCDEQTDVDTAQDPPSHCWSCGKPQAWRVRYEVWEGITTLDRRFLRTIRVSSD